MLLIAALLPLACAQTSDGPPVKTPPSSESATAAPGATLSVPDAGPRPGYVLQAGDDLEIRVFDLPELSQKVKIRPDGRISVLLLDELPAAGVTPAGLTESIRQGYSGHFRNPRVTVAVTGFVNQNVFIGGEVNQPRMIALNGRLSAAAAVFYAGGLKPTAKTKEIIILRNSGKNSARITKLDLEQVLTKGAPDVELQPFDVVFVPKSRIAKLDQFMDQFIKQLQPIAMNMGFSYLLGGQSFQVLIP
jgi:protein involved in polysaccharide export with SLBB domain